MHTYSVKWGNRPLKIKFRCVYYVHYALTTCITCCNLYSVDEVSKGYNCTHPTCHIMPCDTDSITFQQYTGIPKFHETYQLQQHFCHTCDSSWGQVTCHTDDNARSGHLSLDEDLLVIFISHTSVKKKYILIFCI